MKIMLQFPEGLKAMALAEAAKLEKQGHEVFVAAAPCYGACDICLDEARNIGAEKIIHFGHAEFMKVKSDIEIEYVPYFLDVDWKKTGPVIEKGAALLKKEKVKTLALTFPVQHRENSARVKELLEAFGFTVKLGMGGAHVRHPGQVLGCDSDSVKNAGDVDAVVYFGGGKFHPTGIPSDKMVLCIDPHLGDSYWITEEIRRVERKRKGSILAASNAKCFGILVSTKCGQVNLAGARIAKKKLEEKGRKAMLLVANELNPIALQNFMSFDAYINTACPRINDDTDAYGKPIVNVADLKRLLEIMV
ncbi:MAG: diphthamide biosynthesis enzyme Dph2 [Candidatus Micrarchaeota archaeon]|nr:diphthamide biosynthesis enzyme Dph2 [Candidatus Micrarchaeota archaeon]